MVQAFGPWHSTLETQMQLLVQPWIFRPPGEYQQMEALYLSLFFSVTLPLKWNILKILKILHKSTLLVPHYRTHCFKTQVEQVFWISELSCHLRQLPLIIRACLVWVPCDSTLPIWLFANMPSRQKMTAQVLGSLPLPNLPDRKRIRWKSKFLALVWPGQNTTHYLPVKTKQKWNYMSNDSIV